MRSAAEKAAFFQEIWLRDHVEQYIVTDIELNEVYNVKHAVSNKKSSSFNIWLDVQYFHQQIPKVTVKAQSPNLCWLYMTSCGSAHLWQSHCLS